MPDSLSARKSCRANSGLRTLWHQSCTNVMPELIASAAARRVPWYMSPGSNTRPSPALVLK